MKSWLLAFLSSSYFHESVLLVYAKRNANCTTLLNYEDLSLQSECHIHIGYVLDTDTLYNTL